MQQCSWVVPKLQSGLTHRPILNREVTSGIRNRKSRQACPRAVALSLPQDVQLLAGSLFVVVGGNPERQKDTVQTINDGSCHIILTHRRLKQEDCC